MSVLSAVHLVFETLSLFGVQLGQQATGWDLPVTDRTTECSTDVRLFSVGTGAQTQVLMLRASHSHKAGPFSFS